MPSLGNDSDAIGLGSVPSLGHAEFDTGRTQEMIKSGKPRARWV